MQQTVDLSLEASVILSLTNPSFLEHYGEKTIRSSFYSPIAVRVDVLVMELGTCCVRSLSFSLPSVPLSQSPCHQCTNSDEGFHRSQLGPTAVAGGGAWPTAALVEDSTVDRVTWALHSSSFTLFPILASLHD